MTQERQESTPSQSAATNRLGELHGGLKPRRKDQDLPRPADLNDSVKRELYPTPSADEIVAKIPDAKVFTVLDAKSGYLQLKLDCESSLLTTMNTPIGRCRWVLNQSWKCTKEP